MERKRRDAPFRGRRATKYREGKGCAAGTARCLPHYSGVTLTALGPLSEGSAS
jgi:hypothetical protein